MVTVHGVSIPPLALRHTEGIRGRERRKIMDRFIGFDDVVDDALSLMFDVASQCFDAMDDLADYTARRDGVVSGMLVA